MSVKTTADDHLYEAKEHIRQAINELSEIVVKECWGSDDFNKEYSSKINEAFLTLLALRKKL